MRYGPSSFAYFTAVVFQVASERQENPQNASNLKLKSFKIGSQRHSILNDTKVSCLHYLPSHLLTFACPAGMKSINNHCTSKWNFVSKSTSKKIIKIFFKTCLKSFTKFFTMGWIELIKSASDTDKALRDPTRWFFWIRPDTKILLNSYLEDEEHYSEQRCHRVLGID